MNSDRNDPGTNIIDVVIYYWKRSWSWLTPTLGRIWARLIKFAAADPARELADLDRPPDITAHRMGSLIIKALPFMRPMLPHILFMFILGFVFAAVYTVTGAITGDVWLNKILNGEKLQPFQAFVFILDDSYVKPELVDGYEASEANAAEDEAASQLTKDQRRVVRNRSFAWFVIGSIVGIPMGLILPYYGAWIWQNVNHYLRVEMVNRLEYLSLGFHHSNRAGDAIFRIYQDSAQIVNVLNQVVIEPVQILRGLFIAMIFIMIFDPLLIAVALLTYIPMVLLTAWWTPRIRRRSVINRVLNSHLTSRVQETFAALKLVKANRSEKFMLERFDKDSHRALDAALMIRFEMVLLSLVVALIVGCVIIGMELLMISWTIEQRETAFAGMFVAIVGFQVWNYAAFNSANGRFGETLGTGRHIVRVWSMLQDLFIGLERAFYFLQLEPNVVNPEKPATYPEKVDSVSWREVQFRYEDDKPVLEGIDLTAESGTITAIVGATGSGKSTMMSLLLRLYDPGAGAVQINDIDIRDLTLDDIRSKTAIALQKNVLFTAKVADNIAYGLQDTPREDVEAAARVACADEFIREMQDGYDTELGERGNKLSAGQRQRLSIARAIVRDTPVLILDEPTASLDAKTEHDVLANLREWGQERVVFLITHRLSTIRNVDRIAFLENGQIVEAGTHEDLMAMQEGRYRAFVNAETTGVDAA